VYQQRVVAAHLQREDLAGVIDGRFRERNAGAEAAGEEQAVDVRVLLNIL
jgi:hypothetical protein